MNEHLIGPFKFSYVKISIFTPSELYLTPETGSILLKRGAIILKQEKISSMLSIIGAHEEEVSTQN